MVSRFADGTQPTGFDPTPDPVTEPDPPAPADQPRQFTPNNDPLLEPLDDPECALAVELGDVADDIRQLNTEFGLRPYRLFSVVTQWSGGDLGRGEETLLSETEFLPTPKVSTEPLRGELLAGGLTERGTTRVSEISSRYTEDDIFSLFFVQPLPRDHQGYIEMQMDRRDGDRRKRRRFVVQGAPYLDAERFEWRVRMVEQDLARDRDGVLRGAGGQG